MFAPLVMAAAQSAPALAAAANEPKPDAIVVTGERVARSIRNTASSVAIVDEAALRDLAEPDRIDQLLALIPNVQLGSGGEAPVIRGQDATGVVRDLPAFLSGTRPRTTVVVDGRAASYYELAFGLTSIWDLARLEVFRSPQTTTQGRNSIAGAIFVSTADPGDRWEGRARALLGSFDARQLSAVVSGPLDDAAGLAIRLSGDLRHARTSSSLTSSAVGIDPNRDDSELIRLKVRAAPPGGDSALTVTLTHGRSQMPQFEGIAPPFRQRRDPNATYGIFTIGTEAVTAQFSHRASDSLELRATASAGRADVIRRAPAGLGELGVLSRDVSFEPVASWRGPAGLRFTGGMHLARTLLDQAIDLTALAAVRGTGSFTDRQSSRGIFGEGEMPLGPRLTLTAGLRHQHDRQQRRGALVGAALTLPVEYDRSFEAWLPKISLALDISPTLRTGLLVQRAANPGGINLNTATGSIDPFGQESLWAYELFARWRSLSGNVQLNANLFHYAMADTQRMQTVTIVQPNGSIVTGSQVANAPRAWSRGLELDGEWRPSSSFAIRAAAGFLETRITETLLPGDPLLGKRFQRSPPFSGSVSLAWAPAPAWRFSVDARHAASYFSDDRETAERRVAPSTIADAKAAWSRHGLTFSVFARNILDSFAPTFVFPPGNTLITAADPRDVGAAVEWRF